MDSSSLLSRPIRAAENVGGHAAQSARWRGWRLALARVVWVVLAGAMVAVFALGLPLYYHQILSLTNPPVVGDPRTAATAVTDPAAMRLGLHQLGLSVEFYAGYLISLQVAFVLVFLVVGVVIFARRADEPAAWRQSLILVASVLASPNNINALAQSIPTWRPFLDGGSAAEVGAFLVVFPLIFPDGRFVPRWSRWMVIPLLAITGLYVGAPDRAPFLPENWLVFIQVLALLFFVFAIMVGPVYRYTRVANAVQRQQMKWVLFGTLGALVGFTGALVPVIIFPALTQPGVNRIVTDLVTGTVITLSFPLIPVTVGIAILRYRLWDIDILINRTLVYAALTVGVVGIYALIVGYLSLAFRTSGNLLISLMATGVVAVLFQPLRAWVQRGVNRLLFGQRDDPYGVIARLGQRLEATLAPEALLPTIAETVALALKLPYVAITLSEQGIAGGFETSASYGVAREGALRFPLIYQQERLGELILAPRTPGESFGTADKRLLENLARQIGVAAHAIRLTDDLLRANADLQASRERLVSAREEERRRLRRDLHDGLGPTLAALGLKAALVEDCVADEPDRAQALAAELKEDSRTAVADIRRLVYALRPPSLDELGLLGALRELTQAMGRQLLPEVELHITLEAPNGSPALPAAVEVAAYRIVQEALTNVVRHARAHHCFVRLLAEGEPASRVVVEVTDDGVGLPESYAAGVGLRSMRERAAELGGSCEITREASGGSRVLARLPIATLPVDLQPQRLLTMRDGA